MRSLGVLILSVGLLASPLQAAALTEQEAAYELWQAGQSKAIIAPETDRGTFAAGAGYYYGTLVGTKDILQYAYNVQEPEQLQLRLRRLGEDDMERRMQMQAHIAEIAAPATQYQSDREKLAYFNEYLIKHVSYDTAAEQIDFSRQDVDLAPWTAAGAVLDGKAVCEGYASAMLLLCDAVVIPCIKVYGTLAGVPHAWNRVWLEESGTWLNLDVTQNDSDRSLQENESYEKFFLVDDVFLQIHRYHWVQEAPGITIDMRFPQLIAKEIEVLRTLGLIVGKGDDNDALQDTLTRQELATFIMRMEGGETAEINNTPTFSDVDAWAAEPVAYCYQKGYMIGFPDGSFGGQTDVTKQQMATIMLRLVGTDPSRYHWDTAERMAMEVGLLSKGRSSGIHSALATRADISDMLYHVLDTPLANGTTIREAMTTRT